MSALKYLNTILTVLAVLLALQLWTTWMQAPQLTPEAHAQGIPDAGAQRLQMIDQLKLLNQKTDEVKALLTTLTEAGYVGEDVENIIQTLVRNAGGE